MPETKCALRSWCPQPPAPPLVKHTRMDAAKPSHTLQPLYCYGFTSCCCKGPSAELYLGQNPISHQNLTYFLLPLSHCMPLGRNPAPQVSSKTFPFSPALVWWFFSLAGLFFDTAKSHSHCLCKQRSALSWNAVSSFKASQIFVYLFTSQEDAASCLCQYKIVNNVSKDKEK